MTKDRYVAIDIGGSFLKGVLIEINQGEGMSHIPQKVLNSTVVKFPSKLGNRFTINDFKTALTNLLDQLTQNDTISAIGISTAGLVDYAGKKIILVAPHLEQLKSESWLNFLRKKYSVPVALINDSDATAIGCAALGYLKGNQTIGIMPIGTGVGFTVWRNGRKWTPFNSLPLLGSCYTPDGNYDQIISASSLAKYDNEMNLVNIFSMKKYEELREQYIEKLSGVIQTANIIYHVNKILIGGGLADAITYSKFPLTKYLMDKLKQKNIEIEVLSEGNMLPLIGATLLSAGEKSIMNYKQTHNYSNKTTEQPFNKNISLNTLTSYELVKLFWELEQEAGDKLYSSLDILTTVINKVTNSLKDGGRLIYVGAGTSGRLATVDTVEIACTFGFPREKVLTLVAGGLADAAYDIETHFEEDASCIPELLLLNLSPKDVVVGISVSGSAFYVQSALGYAKKIGALSILIQETDNYKPDFCDQIIPLYSGSEIIAGSTRMKAGTATKKIINFLSTSVMIKLGNVYGCYMVNLECINEKLINRTCSILHELFGIEKEKALSKLKNNNYNLKNTITYLEEHEN